MGLETSHFIRQPELGTRAWEIGGRITTGGKTLTVFLFLELFQLKKR